MEKNNYYFGLTRLWWIPLLTGLAFIGFGAWCLCDPSQSLPILAYIFAGCIGVVGIFNMIYGLSNTGNNSTWGWAAACGVIEILFSLFLFFIPEPTLTVAFVYGIGLYIIFMTIFSFWESFMTMRYSSVWVWPIIIFVLAALVFAFLFILGPIGTATLGWLYIGISFICYGIYRILLSFCIRRINRDLGHI